MGVRAGSGSACRISLGWQFARRTLAVDHLHATPVSLRSRALDGLRFAAARPAGTGRPPIHFSVRLRRTLSLSHPPSCRVVRLQHFRALRARAWALTLAFLPTLPKCMEALALARLGRLSTERKK